MSSKKLTCSAILWAVIIMFILPGITRAGESPVKMWEEPLILPTYGVGEPERNPVFYNGKVYQGARGVQYPYPLQDKLTDIRADQSYTAVYLENEYVKVCVLPEIGGRIFSALDKTNDYDFFYRQSVIKPGFIGVLGAWISGGVEWNVPHHHRISTFMPVDYTLEENPDGSRTVWVGEIELRHRLKWLLGITLYPGKSYLEVSARVSNRTSLVHSFLYWANVSVYADSSYQVIFPPSLEYATGHGKHVFTTWPFASSSKVLNNEGYSPGDDLSWWKSHPSPISLFALNCSEDFMAGYDHGKEAGLVHVADHHIVAGKKLWEWGPGPAGRIWDEILTDTDGPYIEIMVGAYTDNQPDYSWIQPYEVKTFKQRWYPLREIGGVKNATLEAAVNLEVPSQNTALLGFNVSAEYRGARAVLTAGDKVIFDQVLDISPAKPFFKEIQLPSGVKEKQLRGSLLCSKGKELVAYTPVKKKGSPMPEPVTAPPPPEEVKTIEELYLAGMRLEQFHNAALEPDPYYQEALRRDPGDYRTNIAVGILYLKRKMFEQAEQRIAAAIQRITAHHTRPRDGEAYYYLGVACKAQGKNESAWDAFYNASWSAAWYSASFFALAQLATEKGNYSRALAFLNRCLSTNFPNSKAHILRCALLRKLGRFGEAIQAASMTLAADPLDFWAGNELYLARLGMGAIEEAEKQLNQLKRVMRGSVQNYLETATDYGSCGLWEEAVGLLTRFAESEKSPEAANPLVYYYLGYYSGKKGDHEQATRYYRRGSRMPPDYVFPFRLESIDMLRAASGHNTGDSRAPYYLGNLLFDSQPEKAITEWEKSRQLDGSFSIVHRNLGLAYARIRNDIPKAIASLERAISCNKNNPRLYLELDELYETGGVAPEKRLAFLENNQNAVTARDDLLSREIVLYVLLGQYDRAIQWLDNHLFHVWEGRGEIHDIYVDAHIARGEEYFRERKYRQALKDFQAALLYPKNLGVGPPRSGGRPPQVYYFIGTAHEALGDQFKAQEYYEKSAEATLRPGTEIGYYQGLALRKLGRESEADRIFHGLVQTGRKSLVSASPDYFAKFGEKQTEEVRRAQAHYILGLGYLGQGNPARARQEFERVLELNITHRRAGKMLAAM